MLNIYKVILFFTIICLIVIPIYSENFNCSITKAEATSTTTEKFIVILDKNAANNHFNMLSTCLEKKVNNFDPSAISQEEPNKDENEVLVFYFDSFTAYFSDFDSDFAMNKLNKVEGVQLVEKSYKIYLTRSITTATLKNNKLTKSNTSLYNLDRIDTGKRKYDGFYTYPTNAGRAVNAYVMDTGIRMTHHEFKGRIKLGGVFCNGCANGDDELGHGTHVADCRNNIWCCKISKHHQCEIMGKYGGDLLAATKGINYVINAHKNAKNKNSIINMSFSTLNYSDALAALVKECTDNGIHVVASAGNDHKDACLVTPASVPSAITVAASDKLDKRANFSNYGPCVDIYAPGVKILSAFTSNDNDSVFFDGTSMSAPHVVGTVALYISTYGNLPPSNMSDAIISLATKNIIKNPNSTVSYFLRVPH
ncbi:subtilisin-like protein [Gigaspora margarita]|uniref:Subtilisin-like protein n=1 Tax=Gigaspora margarita TaxID=4874 RepID=A0A8H3WXR5_GIGMA|nr:subtilisin-like protein [Gigaspora margarita]